MQTSVLQVAACLWWDKSFQLHFAPVVNDGQAARASAWCWPLSGITVLGCSCVLSLQPWLMHLSDAEACQVPLKGSQALGCRPSWGLHGDTAD